MLFSNVFLVLPVVFAYAYHAWLYLFLAVGLLIFSPLYHWCEINRPKSVLYKWFQAADVGFAWAAFIYMYYYALQYDPAPYKAIMLLLLTALVAFFWYGQGIRHERLHPWFHVLAPVVSSAILVAANL